MSAVIQQDDLNFRPMQESDLPDIMVIEQSAYPFPWTRTIFQDCLSVGYCSWVLERNGVINAYGVMSVAVGECHILNLCVQPDYQGMGFGEMFLEFLLDLARKHNAETAFLEVRPSNTVAKKLYTNKGFNEVGLRKNYYPDVEGREDALIMARSLV